MADYNSDRTGANIDLTLDKVDALDAKVQPTGTGANVTGTLVSDGLTVDGLSNMTGDRPGGSVGGTTLIKGRYATGHHHFNLGSMYSEGANLLGYGVESSKSASNSFISTLSNYSAPRSALTSGEDVNFFTASAQNTAVGSPVAMSKRLKIANNGDVFLYEDTGTSAKFHWDASAERLNVGGNTNYGYGINVGDDGYGINSTGVAPIVMRGTEYRLQGVNPSPMTFYTTNSERMRISPVGNVGVGTANPADKIDIYSLSGGLRIGSSTNSSNIAWNNASGTMEIEAKGNNWPITFRQNGTERARIDSSGNLLVGTTSPLNAKFKVGGGGHYAYVQGSTDGISGWIGDTGSTGAGTETSLIIGSGDWYSGAEERAVLKLLPNHGSVGSNAGFSISSERSTTSNTAHAKLNFRRAVRGTSVDDTSVATLDKDGGLWLNDGVYLGGTGSANKLDDYEVGIWTPTLFGATGGTGTLTVSSASYTKIGNMVRVNCYITAVNVTGLTGSVRLGGLPFSVSQYSVGAVSFCNLFNFDERDIGVSLFSESGQSYVNIMKGVSNYGVAGSEAGATNGSMMMTMVYKTNL